MAEVEGYYVDDLGNSEELKSGDVVWIHPGNTHAYGPRSGQAWTQIYLILDGTQWEHWVEEGVWDINRPVSHAAPVDYWRGRFHDAFSAEDGSDPATAMRTMGVVHRLIFDLLAAREEGQRDRGEAWLRESQQLLGERGAPEDLSPHVVAQKVGMSYESFRKKFAERLGESPGHFQKRRRIEHACASIYQGTHSFKELADELGFCDVFHFSKTFRQVTGETPSDFRRRVRGG
ncbi:MAG: hypothetical protein SynsKO_28900 [Synoicihabitans sp.]